LAEVLADDALPKAEVKYFCIAPATNAETGVVAQ